MFAYIILDLDQISLVYILLFFVLFVSMAKVLFLVNPLSILSLFALLWQCILLKLGARIGSFNNNKGIEMVEVSTILFKIGG